jgi:hypothetical protein
VSFNPPYARIPLTGFVLTSPSRDGRLPVFVAYPYDFDPEYREMLRRIEPQARIEFKRIDDDPSSFHLVDKIHRNLMSCSVAIFDLSDWNPNVALEFGMCVAMVGNRRENVWLVLDENRSENVPSDIEGLGQNRYNSLEDLETKLTAHLSKRFPLDPSRPRVQFR